MLNIPINARKSPEQILEECMELRSRKAADYQNENSRVVQNDYYPNGVCTILDIIHAKYLRAVSLIEAHTSGSKPNFESLEDTFKDLVNYASFAASYCTGGIEGQPTEFSLTSNKAGPDVNDGDLKGMPLLKRIYGANEDIS